MMRAALRRETVRFGRDFVKTWGQSSSRFKLIAVTVASFLALIVATEIARRVFSGHYTPDTAGIVLTMVSIRLAKLIGKNQRWL